MRLAVIGAGNVGLVASACFADSGHDVTCVDIDAQKIAAIQQGRLPFYEEGLSDLVQRCTREALLQFSSDAPTAIRSADVIFVAVGTPIDAQGGIDLTAVHDVVQTIAHVAKEPKVLVLKSTVPVGTNARIAGMLKELGAGEIEVVSNPEFLKEGVAVLDFRRPDRVVLGVRSKLAASIMRDLYEPFVRTGAPLLFMDPASAELTSFTANAMLATRISFMNAIAGICEEVGADVEQIRRAVGADRRIGSAYLFAGTGYGGSGLTASVQTLARSAREAATASTLFDAVARTNECQRRLLAQKIVHAFKPEGGLSGRTVAVWGLSFKGNTDDLRESPALTLIEDLLQHGAHIRAHDPVAVPRARSQLNQHERDGRVFFAQTMYEAAVDADALAIVTDWNEYRRPEFARLRQQMRRPWVFDGRNLWDPQHATRLGFTYRSIGRSDVATRSSNSARPI